MTSLNSELRKDSHSLLLPAGVSQLQRTTGFSQLSWILKVITFASHLAILLRVSWQREEIAAQQTACLLYAGIKQYAVVVAVEIKQKCGIISKGKMVAFGNTAVGDEGKVKDGL